MSKSLDALNVSIELQAKKLAEMRAKKQQLEARERTRLKLEARRADTRRKILLGSYVLAVFEATSVETASALPAAIRELRLREKGLSLDGFLTRDDDRALFGFVVKAAA